MNTKTENKMQTVNGFAVQTQDGFEIRVGMTYAMAKRTFRNTKVVRCTYEYHGMGIVKNVVFGEEI